MDKIKNDFKKKELKRIAIFIGGVALVIIVRAIVLKNATDLLFYFCIIAAIMIYFVVHMNAQLKNVTNNLTADDIDLLGKEYEAEHTVYEVWLGEIHLMPNYIVCRNGGNLYCIVIRNIQKVEWMLDAGPNSFVKFIMNKGANIKVNFANNPREREEVRKWCIDKLGNEKVS